SFLSLSPSLCLLPRPPPASTLFPYTTLFRSTNGVFFLEFPDQWTTGSPWADRRVRLAASLSVDRQAINEAESLGFSGITGSFIRSEEHTSELQSLAYLVCRLLLEKKKKVVIV